MRHIYLYGAVCLLLLQGCAPRPVFRMTPKADHTTFDEGIEYVQLNQKEIELTISYYQHLGQNFVMDVGIYNASDSIIRVDPQQFFYEAYYVVSNPPPTEKDEILVARKAIDPEQKLLEKDLETAQSEADQRTSNLLFAIGQTASVVQSVIEEDPERREELWQDREESLIYHLVNKEERAHYRQELRDSREVWELDALRKTDLFPGESIRGYVFFKNEEDARIYAIHFKPEGAEFTVFYEQKKYQP